jgi:hypothetical protein
MMISKYFLLLMMILLVGLNSYAQEYSKAERKVQIFTPDEKDNLQMWFHKEIHAMDFTEEELDEYYAVVFYYISKISRLDDLDKGYTAAEFKVELNKLLAKQDADIKGMLTSDRYEIHNKTYDVFLVAAYKRWGIVN